jgi:hypothetical protein
MPQALTTTEAAETFQVVTSEMDAAHYVVNVSTGEIVRGYPLAKTANRAARNLNDLCGYVAPIEPPATSSPLLADGPVTFSDDAPAIDLGEAHIDHVAAMATLAREANPEPAAETAADFLARIQQEAADFTPPTAPKAKRAKAPKQIDVEDIAPTGQRAEVIRHPVPDVILTREDWLNAASLHIEEHLGKLAGLDLPSFRVTCGWPSSGGTGSKKRTLGQCWNPEASSDAHAEVFISPMEAEPVTVLAILAHELIHACLPKGTGHKGPFVKAAKALGFAGPFTQLNMTDELRAWAQVIVDALPAYPHAAITPGGEGDKKPQTNRQLLATCEAQGEGSDCYGYKVRLSRKWIDLLGAPICPVCMVQMVCEGLDPQDQDGPEGEDE